jgi:flagellar biosynthetic protein FliR
MINYTFSLLSFEYFLLILVRIASFVAVAPFFGLSNVPARVKVGFSAAIAILIAQANPGEISYGGMLEYGIIVCREAITGLLMGMMANACTYIIGFAGRLIDMQIGLSMAQEYNPLTRTQESITGNMYYYSILLLLLISDLYQYIIKAIADSFTLIPVNSQVFQWEYLVNSIVTLVTDMMILGFRIMLPVFACCMTVNCILGIMSKVAPQMHMFAVGMQIKIFSGYAVLVVTVLLLPRAASLIADEIKEMLRMVVKGMYGAG